MPLHFGFRTGEVIKQPYGLAYVITKNESGFKNIRSLVIIIEPGQRTTRHYHPVEELFFILKGTALFEGLDTEFRVGKDDVVLARAQQFPFVLNYEDHYFRNGCCGKINIGSGHRQ